MFGRKKDKIPKIDIPEKLKKLDAERDDRIEIRYGLSPLSVMLGYPPRYSIMFKGDDLGYVGVFQEKDKNGRDTFEVRKYFSFGGSSQVLGQESDLAEATFLAYRSAQRIGLEIANANKISLEDLALEDEERMRADNEMLGKKMRQSVFFIMFAGGIALSILSLRSTGNAIGSLTGTTPGLLGIFLFIFGIVGLVFNLRKK